MKYCSNCGKKIVSENYCSNCGQKTINENRIDRNLETIRNSVASVNNDISSSNYVSKIKSQTISAIAKFYIFLGYVSIFILVMQLASCIFFNKKLLFIESYQNSKGIWYTFIGEITATTLLPFIFLYLSCRIKKSLGVYFYLLLAIYIIMGIYELSTSSLNNEKEIISNQIDSYQKLDDNTNQNNFIDTTAVEGYANEKKVLKNEITFYNSTGYHIYIESEIDVYGEGNVILKKGEKVIDSRDFNIWEGNIRDFKIQNRFIYFASPIAGGTAGNFYIEYFCIDLKEEKIISVIYECNDTYSGCHFQDLSFLDDYPDIYSFLMSNIRLPEANDDYFKTSNNL